MAFVHVSARETTAVVSLALSMGCYCNIPF